jgi:hypothetical protein
MYEKDLAMTYQEYKSLRARGCVSAGIDHSTALKLVWQLPKRYQYANLVWSWIWMLSIPGFICVSIFVKWWAGLVLLFIVTPAIMRATKATTAQHVLEYAEENEEFFNYLLEKDVIRFAE